MGTDLSPGPHEYIHCNDVVMSAIASQITSFIIIYSTVYSRRRSKKTSKLRATGLLMGIHRWSVDSPHKGIVTRKMFLFDDVNMKCILVNLWCFKENLPFYGFIRITQIVLLWSPANNKRCLRSVLCPIILLFGTNTFRCYLSGFTE